MTCKNIQYLEDILGYIHVNISGRYIGDKNNIIKNIHKYINRAVCQNIYCGKILFNLYFIIIK